MTTTDRATPAFDVTRVDVGLRPPQEVPASAVCEVSFEYPWAYNTRELSEWHRAVSEVLDRDYCGDSLAEVANTNGSIVLDLGRRGGWGALYAADRADTIVGELRRVLDRVTEAAGVEPVILTLRRDLPAGVWGDDVSQVDVTRTDVVVDATLWTRDGEQVGNAIVIEVESPDRVWACTDYGNIVGPLTRAEVDAWWRVGPLNPTHKYAGVRREV